MSAKGWKYYNHAMLPTCAPHETPDLRSVKDGSIWHMKDKGMPVFARWISDWDCGYETKFWYIIKDTPLDINTLKSKRRYEINKGTKNFNVRKINPEEYAEEICDCAVEAYKAYSEKDRPFIDKEEFIFSIINEWSSHTVFAAFNIEGKLCAYAELEDYGSYVDFFAQKSIPTYEKYAVNAALVKGILDYYNERLATRDFYISDGSRTIRHESHFQDYLEKYFDFRKAYCILNIELRPTVKLPLMLLKSCRNVIDKLDCSTAHNILSLLQMMEMTGK